MRIPNPLSSIERSGTEKSGRTVIVLDIADKEAASSPLRDAALYITKLPKAEHDADEWQAAMAAEHDGPAMFARIGVMWALSAAATPRHRKKAARKYRIVR
jgi:hypothetical protein